MYKNDLKALKFIGVCIIAWLMYGAYINARISRGIEELNQTLNGVSLEEAK